MTHSFLILALVLLLGASAKAQAVTPAAQASTSTVDTASQATLSPNSELLGLQQAEVTKVMLIYAQKGPDHCNQNPRYGVYPDVAVI